MNHCGTQTLETDRLILRRLTMADVEAVYRNWASDPEVTRFLTWPTHTDPEVTKYVIGTWLPLYEKPDYYHWAITLKANGGEPIGTIHGLPNDDLELQLVWLEALERHGAALTCRDLGEVWKKRIHHGCDEYSIAVYNLTHGLTPPATGYCNNFFADGMGAAIRFV